MGTRRVRVDATVIAQTPELADGGYWYVVPSVPDPDEGGRTPGDIPSGWCAWYGTVGGADYAAVRSPDPALIPQAVNTPVGVVLASESGKPFGRVGSR